METIIFKGKTSSSRSQMYINKIIFCELKTSRGDWCMLQNEIFQERQITIYIYNCIY